MIETIVIIKTSILNGVVLSVSTFNTLDTIEAEEEFILQSKSIASEPFMKGMIEVILDDDIYEDNNQRVSRVFSTEK